LAASEFAPGLTEKRTGEVKTLVLVPCAKQAFITRRVSRVKPTKEGWGVTLPDREQNRFSRLHQALAAAPLSPQILLQRFPVMRPPSGREMHGCALREAGVIENEFRFRSRRLELELHD
jgi:hypothetical protein